MIVQEYTLLRTGDKLVRTNLVKLARICCIFLVMATFSARATEDSVSSLAQNPRCASGLEWIDKNSGWVTDQQIRLTEIPAPEFNEARRGEFLKDVFEATGLKVRIDETGNVIGERAEDVFYVTDSDNRPLDEEAASRLRESLIEALDRHRAA